MGLIKAVVGATGGVLADAWREFVYCDADVLDERTLAVKAQVRKSERGRSSNTKRDENIISDGSVIAVNDGQCMIIVESGEIVEVCAEPGQFTYDKSSEPSLFFGSLGESVKRSFERLGRRIGFGGDTGNDQRVYYFNTKEIYGNKYGTSTPIPFRVVDSNLGLDMDTVVRMNGEYSFRLVDPLAFYKNVCGNVEEPYTRDRLESQMKSELLTALQPALAKISAEGVRYSKVPAHARELASALNEELSEQWMQQRGIRVEQFGVNSISLPEEVESRISERQMAQTLIDPNAAAATVASATADAMRTAAGNESGAMNAFMGMGMASGMGGGAAASMFAQGAACGSVPAGGGDANGGAVPGACETVAGSVVPGGGAMGSNASAAGWSCAKCGASNSGNFCSQCGSAKPTEATRWFCPQCGSENHGNFCPNDGTPRS